MDPFELIKEIKTLHSLVKVTRTHIILKLTRDNKFWAAKALSNSSNQRAKRRAESSKAILNHLKAVSLPELVEQVLQYQPLKDEASLQSAPVAHRSIERFLEDEKLNRHLKSLESQFGAGSHSKILDALKKKSKIKSLAIKKQRKERILKRIDALERKKKKLEKKLNQKDQPKEKTSLSQKLDNIEPDSCQETDDENNPTTQVCDSYGSDDDSEELNVEHHESDEGEQSDQQNNESASIGKDENYSSEEEDTDHSEEEPQSNIFNVEIVKKPVGSNEGSIKKADLSVRQHVKDPPMKTAVNYKAPEEEDDQEGYELVRDSFFVTDTGAQYVAVAPKLKSQNDDDGEDEPEESWKLVNRRKRREQQREDPYTQEEFDTTSNHTKQRKVSANNFSNGKFNRSDQTQDLHPSWAAKQAQKGIKTFAGKKVVFDAEGDGGRPPSFNLRPTSNFNEESDLHPSWAAKQAQKGIKPFTGKKVVFDAEDDGARPPSLNQKPSISIDKDSDLHPSWAAKQAQKGIKPFAGKKVVFDAEDDGGRPPSLNQKPSTSIGKDSDLHPSWAAKQAQKGIKPFAGTKVVFDNDDDSGRTSSFNLKPTSILNPSWAAKQDRKSSKPFSDKKIVFDAENTNGMGKNGHPKKSFTSSNPPNDLHPSWTAKLAQKAMVPFAGKKINFTADDATEKKASSRASSVRSVQKSFTTKSVDLTKTQSNQSSDLHPSWAAKQAQSGIKPFAGTKISFED